MNITVNICLGLAGLIYLLLLAAIAMDAGKSSSDMSGFVVFPILSFALFILFSITFCAAPAAGELDWTGMPRAAQYSGVVVSCLALMIVVALSALVRTEPVSQTPWAIRPFIPWAPIVVPAVMIAVAFLWLNKDIGSPAVVLRGVFLGLSVVGIVTGLALLGEVFYWNQQRALQRIETLKDRESDRDRTILAGVEAADPEKDFGSLLAQTSRFENPAIRKLALEKVLSTGASFTSLMTAQLHHYYYFASALTFLRDNDPPDKAPLAEPVRGAFLLVVEQVRENMRDAFNPRGFQFVSSADEVLTVADKYATYGVDYVPVIREYRAALDVPGKSERYQEQSLKNDLESRKQLDRWLAVHNSGK
jgi:hypothetical protein